MYTILTTFLLLSVLSKKVISDDFMCGPIVREFEAREFITDLKEYCKTMPCLYKLCPPNNLRVAFADNTQRCMTFEDVMRLSNGTLNLSSVEAVYQFDEEHSELNPLQKKMTSGFKFLDLVNLTNSDCEYISWTMSTNESSYVILENGSLLIEHPNSRPRFIIVPVGEFVFEYYVKQDISTGIFHDPLMIVRSFEISTDDNTPAYISSIGMLISCFFMVLFLIVFSVLPQLRTLANQILMTYVACLLIGFLITAIHSLDGVLLNCPYYCEISSVIQYYALMSSYLWLNVIAFDIFWAIRANYKLHPTNRRGINYKFRIYSLYAFGIPFLMTGVALTIDMVDLSNARDIVKIGFSTCLNTVSAVNFYVYVPITIVIAINAILFLLTVFNIWRVRRALSSTGDSGVKRNENRFYIYFKLSLITGVHWFLDIMNAFFDLPSWIVYISEAYNVLIGVIIFILYVCKKQYLYDICKRFSIGAGFIARIDRRKSSKASTVLSRSETGKSMPTDQTMDDGTVTIKLKQAT